MDSLLKIKKVKNMKNLNGSQKLYTDVENCDRNLKSLDVEHPLMVVFLFLF